MKIWALLDSTTHVIRINITQDIKKHQVLLVPLSGQKEKKRVELKLT